MPQTPPVARRVPKIEVVHGEIRQDDYHWLRQKDDPEVQTYLKAENAYTDAVMEPTEKLQESLYREILARIKEDDSTVPYRRDGYLYYTRTEKGKQYPIYCRRAGTPEGPEEVTLDLNQLAEGHEFLALGAYAVSDDGRHLAYSLDYTGARDYTLSIKDLVTGELLPDRIDKVSTVAWSVDDGILFYVHEDHAKRPYRLYRHRLGDSADVLLHEESDELFRLGVWRSRSRRFLFSMSRSFTSAEVRFLPADQPSGTWSMVAPREKDHEYDVDHAGDLFYIRTNGDGLRNFRLVVAPVNDPGRRSWRELIPHREHVMLEDVDVFAHHYIAHEREEGLIRLRVTEPATGAFHHVEFPEPTYDVAPEPNAEFVTPVYRFRYQSLITPPSVFDYDVSARRLTLLKQTEVLGGYDPSRYRSERLYAKADDGTRVPISLVARIDTPRDGSSPMLLTGYGAYGIAYPASFGSSRLSLLDRGVTIAIAHVRGGGELGKRWHDAGRLLHKRHTFTDFIAATEHLIASGYTASDRLAIEGGSAGGLLIGAVLNLRPDLYHAAELRVPFVDVVNTMLDESLPLTVGEFEEWGNPKDPVYHEYIRSYCPYSNLAPRSFPTLLIRTSLYDSQVMYWEPAKYVARLRALGSDERGVLFKIDMGAGHGGPSGRYDALQETAFDYAWLLTRLDRASNGTSPAIAG